VIPRLLMLNSNIPTFPPLPCQRNIVFFFFPLLSVFVSFKRCSALHRPVFFPFFVFSPRGLQVPSTPEAVFFSGRRDLNSIRLASFFLGVFFFVEGGKDSFLSQAFFFLLVIHFCVRVFPPRSFSSVFIVFPPPFRSFIPPFFLASVFAPPTQSLTCFHFFPRSSLPAPPPFSFPLPVLRRRSDVAPSFLLPPGLLAL